MSRTLEPGASPSTTTHRGGIDLGIVEPDAATLDGLAAAWASRVNAEPYLAERDRWLRTPLGFSHFCEAAETFDRSVRDERRREVERWKEATRGERSGTLHVLGPEPPHVALYRRQGHRPDFTPDLTGYRAYLAARIPLDKLLAQSRRAMQFPVSGLVDSVLVVGPRGWGKSELLKALIRHTIEAPNDHNPASAVVVLDAGGDLAREVARWPELSGMGRRSGRLLFVQPGLKLGHTVGLNPLDGTGLDHEGRNTSAAMLAAALEVSSAPLSMNMETLVVQCATVLLSRPGSTLRDLRTMLRDPRTHAGSAELYAYACRYPDPDVREWFEFDFLSDPVTGSKGWLMNRLQRLFATHHLAAMFGGQQTLDLRAALDARKVVLVDLAAMEARSVIGTAGRLWVTAIGALLGARGRPGAPRTPVLLVIDEVTLLAGSELVEALALLRKYGLNIIMAQQVAASGFSPEDKVTLLGNTGGRLIGGQSRRQVAELLHVEGEAARDLPQIEPHQFWVRWREVGGPHLVNVRSDLLKATLSVTDEEWAAYVSTATGPEGAGGFYRPDKPALIEPVAAASETPADPPATPKPKRSRAKPAEVNVVPTVPRVPRPSKGTKPVAKPKKTLDVKPSGRTLDD